VGSIHSVWGWWAISLCGVAGLYGIGLGIVRRPPNRLFWLGLGMAVTALIVQVGMGVWAMGVDGIDPGNQHVFYGVVVAFTLGFAYIYRTQLGKRPALYYGLLLLFLMGLGIRGILTFGNNF
jgi:hypothetical protein